MPGDLERYLRLRGVGPTVLAAELLGRLRAELPVIGELGEREHVPGGGVADRTAVSAHPPRAACSDGARL